MILLQIQSQLQQLQDQVCDLIRKTRQDDFILFLGLKSSVLLILFIFVVTLELRDGDGMGSGHVYVANSEGYFGPVCDDIWGNNHANVVCRQLGFPGGIATTSSHFGPVSTSIFAMDNVQCTGTEASLIECTHLTSDNCGTHEGAGVKCGEDNLDIGK